ncbi:membrane protein [Shigella sonnei]|nr:membrane protein [Shigella sonnei]
MAVKISGVLKDGTGKPVQNCTIQLKAKRNSTTVVVNTLASENPDEAGRYSMDVEYGQYSVILLVEGFPPSHAGTITMAGPSVRVNEWFSAYAMAGVAYSRVSTFSGDYIRVTDNKGKTHDVLTGSDDGRHSNTSLAWGAGVQFNPTESVAIDIAYEGSGSGDWRTDGFIVGVGYKF